MIRINYTPGKCSASIQNASERPEKCTVRYKTHVRRTFSVNSECVCAARKMSGPVWIAGMPKKLRGKTRTYVYKLLFLC